MQQIRRSPDFHGTLGRQSGAVFDQFTPAGGGHVRVVQQLRETQFQRRERLAG